METTFSSEDYTGGAEIVNSELSVSSDLGEGSLQFLAIDAYTSWQ